MKGPVPSPTGGSTVYEFLIILAVIGLWFALQLWILPSLGVPT